jgi:hypothetical protein
MAPKEFSHDFFASLNCSTPVTWTKDIAKLFTPTDVAHMKGVTGNRLDLSSYQSVKVWASAIYQQVSSGSMPPPGSGESPWTQAMINTFGCWIQQGCPQ